MTVRRRWRRGKPEQSQELTRIGRVQVPSGNHSLARRGYSGDRKWRRRASGGGSSRSGRTSKEDWKLPGRTSLARGSDAPADGAAQADPDAKGRSGRASGGGGGFMGPSIQQGFVNAPGSGEAGRRDRCEASSEAQPDPGDRREARMPLPARVEHAAETRWHVLRVVWPKSGDTGAGSDAGPLLLSAADRATPPSTTCA